LKKFQTGKKDQDEINAQKPSYTFNVHLSFLSIFFFFFFAWWYIFSYVLGIFVLYISFLFFLWTYDSFFFLLSSVFFLFSFFGYLLVYVCQWVKLIIKERKSCHYTHTHTNICRLLFISFAMLFFFLKELVMYAYNTIIDGLVKYVYLIFVFSVFILHQNFSIHLLVYGYKYIFFNSIH